MPLKLKLQIMTVSKKIFKYIIHDESLIVMVIGFTEERQYVSENQVPGVDEFLVYIDLATLRVSEREHRMLFRLLASGAAYVVSFASFSATDFDARYGGVEGDPIEEMDFLDPGEDMIRPRRIAIVNDFIIENEECFTIQISPINIPGIRELFICDFVDISTSPPTNYYCEHTICIEDNDGKIITMDIQHLYLMNNYFYASSYTLDSILRL